MILEYGDLVKKAQLGEFDVIIQGCNCFHTMGAGLAKHIRAIYPEVYEADKTSIRGDINKLGDYTSVDVSSGDNKFTIVNAYTQHRYGRDRDNFSYETLPKLLSKIKSDFNGKRIGMSVIGCSLAGGNEPAILHIIEKEFKGVDFKFVDIDSNRKLKLNSPDVVNAQAFRSDASVGFTYKDIKFETVDSFVDHCISLTDENDVDEINRKIKSFYGFANKQKLDQNPELKKVLIGLNSEILFSATYENELNCDSLKALKNNISVSQVLANKTNQNQVKNISQTRPMNQKIG